jgi:hypothetical protein
MTGQQPIDVTGLPEPVVTSLQRLVDGLRATLPAGGEAAPIKPHQLPVEERLRLFREWVDSHRDITAVADDSRDSIYEGR